MKSIHKILLIILILAFLIGGFFLTFFYNQVYGVNVEQNDKGYHHLYISSKDDYQTVLRKLSSNGILNDESSFDRVARKMNYPNKIFPGKYKILNGMNNRSLINLLRSAQSEEVKVVVNATRNYQKIASEVGKKLEADSTVLIQLLEDEKFLAELGFTKESLPALFTTDTYNFPWGTTSKGFLQRMKKEHDGFWTDARKAKAKSKNMTPNEVVTLASIVEEETYHNEEMPKVAEVYLNRLEKGWLLQADPTVKYAVGNFELKRVLDKHLAYDSPYNTYMYEGLPPGPICVPSKQAIDAVLHPDSHDFFYFCAKDDFSMFHAFATNLSEHMVNARRYQRALNRKKIF